MRLVQRHGRIDRIGSPHNRVFLRTIFPAERLDQLLKLEQRILYIDQMWLLHNVLWVGRDPGIDRNALSLGGGYPITGEACDGSEHTQAFRRSRLT